MSRAAILALALAALSWDAAVAAPADRPLRDPFARPAPPAPAVPAQPVAPEPLRLRAIILNGARSLANIDGDIVGVGERARDYTVLRIDAHGVLVARAGASANVRQLLSISEKDKQ